IEGTNANHNFVAGNHIGVGADGAKVLSNTTAGVLISRGRENIVGMGGGGRNVIGGSDYGVWVRYAESVSNRIEGNYIGVAANGITPAPNRLYNVYVYGAPGT
ncbi:hypothetical protein RZS08_38500, partial [Arthrospira platensis SPKY1]|nr:hypothetical protein [Arthrospira platensis SPKY1]